jgi:hypothetical protein
MRRRTRRADALAARMAVQETASGDIAEVRFRYESWQRAREALDAQVAALVKLRRGQAAGEIDLSDVLFGERQVQDAFRAEAAARTEAMRMLDAHPHRQPRTVDRRCGGCGQATALRGIRRRWKSISTPPAGGGARLASPQAALALRGGCCLCKRSDTAKKAEMTAPSRLTWGFFRRGRRCLPRLLRLLERERRAQRDPAGERGSEYHADDQTPRRSERGVFDGLRESLVPGQHRVDQIVALHEQVEQDSGDVKGHEQQQDIEHDLVRFACRIARIVGKRNG